MKIKNLNNFFWIFPFLSFILGYYLLHFFLKKNELNIPNVIGQSLQKGINIFSKKGLSIRLLREQEDSDLSEGIILDQIPKPKQKIRPDQHVFVTVSKKPKAILAPDLLGFDQKFVTKFVEKKGIQIKTFWQKSLYPIDSCIAQYPQSGKELVDREFIIYLSEGNEKFFIVPDLKNCKVSQLKEIIEKENIKLEIFHIKKEENNHTCENCFVVDQKPMSGSIIDMSKTLHIQVQVKS